MPIPKPNKGETETKFRGRCMGDSTMSKEYPESKQRLAICMGSWRKVHGGKPPVKKEQFFQLFSGLMDITEAFFSLRSALEAAVHLTGGKRTYVVDFSNKEVVYRVYRDGGEIDSEGEEVYYRAKYKIKGKEVILLGVPEKVNRTVQYEQLETKEFIGMVDNEIQLRG